MPRSCSHIYLHFVWATWDRLPLIKPELEAQVYACMAQKCEEQRCKLIAIGGTANHIHALVRIRALSCAMDIVKNMKGTSSHLMTHVLKPNQFFKWQGTYGVRSVDLSGVETVRAYIRNQKEHHANNDVWPEWEQCMAEDDEPAFD